MKKLTHLLALALAALLVVPAQAAEKKKIVLVAGTPSHGPGDHEFNAGCLLLKKCLDQVPGVEAVVQLNGWPKDESVFNGAAAVFLFMDGGGGHPVIQGERLQLMEALMQKGVGLGCAHYAVEVPKEKGGPEFLRWIGGYYETGYSTNPHWVADIKSLPKHPVTRGVKPFAVMDEWYYNMRFRPDMTGVTPLLVATPSDETREGKSSSPRGPYPHIVEAKGRAEVLSWAVERPDGGRGFGFTGGHKHANWGDDNFRKFVLNAVLWLAKMDVPRNGVKSAVTAADLAENLDPKPGRAQAPAAAAGARGFGPEAARKELQSFTVPDGLEVTLFASEPRLVNPANMDVDSRGRVWVTEGANYRQWKNLRPGGDRIMILEDTDGDGVADKETVFYQGNEINTALGICVLGKKVIVSCSPKILVFSDENDDGKADGPPQVLFNGISGEQHDHGVHAFVFGPDGKLYFNMGNAGRQLKNADASKTIVDLAGNAVKDDGKPYRQGMVFRCNPDGSQLETLAWNFRNNYEVSVDSFGTLWQPDNDDDGNKGVRINYVMEFGNYGYTDEKTGAGWQTKRTNLEQDIPSRHWYQNDPGVVPNLLQTGSGSPTGMAIYEGTLLPKVFRNQMIHCEPGHNVVRAYPVRPSGAGYQAEMVDILKSSDSWFRPSDVCVGPDGSIYVADWNDAGVGGHAMADHDLATMRGRVYRVAPKGHKPVVPKLDLKSMKGSVAALQSPNLATRYLAWTTLHAAQGKAEKELVKAWKSTDDRTRARALHLLARIPGKEQKYVNAAMADGNPDIRITGLRIARQQGGDLTGLLRKLVKDPSAQVRRECAIALRHNASAEAPALWATLAQQHDGKDRWYLEALGIGAYGQEDKYFNTWLERVGSQWNTAAGRDIIWRSRAKKVPDLLVKIISDKATSAAEKPRYIRALDFISGPEKDAALIQLLGVN